MSQILAVTVIPLVTSGYRNNLDLDINIIQTSIRWQASMTDSALKDSNSSSSGLSLDECEEAGEEVSDTVRVTSQVLVAQHWLLNGRFYVVLAGVKCRTPLSLAPSEFPKSGSLWILTLGVSQGYITLWTPPPILNSWIVTHISDGKIDFWLIIVMGKWIAFP